MKRNLFILALFVAAFCFAGVAIAQDAGNPDTLYLEPWASDVGVFEPGPWFVKVQMLVTNDLVTAATDSIAGFVIPLCYTVNTPFGAVDYCSTSLWWNGISMLDIPAGEVQQNRSVFRHLPSMQDIQVHNKMLDMNADFIGGWDFVVLDLGDEVSRFWFTAVPTGTMDQRWGPGSRALLATMTFKASFEDSFDLCIDSCFWPPASRLAYSNSNAETYIPKIWDDYLGEESFCFRPYVVPNIPPTVDCPGNQSFNTNGTKTVTGVVGADVDGNIVSATAAISVPCGQVSNVQLVNVQGLGTPSMTADVQFDVSHCAQCTDVIEVTVTDDAGGIGTCTFEVTCTNTSPTVSCPANASFKYCAGFAGDAVGSDADGDAITYAISGVPGIGIDASGHITWAPGCNDVGGPYTVTVTVTDACQATGLCTFQLTVTNAAPTITCPDNAIVTSGSPFVSTDFTVTDDCPPAGVVAAIAPAATNDPTIVGSHVEWQTTVAEEGDYTITLTATDECGLTAECSFTVQVVSYGFTNVLIPNSECANPGEYVCLPILLDNNTTPFGGFELALEFDYTAMTLVGVEPGPAVEGFEYFTYRLLPCPLCGCCKYKILLYGQYDMPDGVENIGDPIPMTPQGVYQTIANLCFVINNDENLRGLKIPVCFEWEGTIDPETGCLVEDWNCAENTFSSLTGDTLYTSGLCCQFVAGLCDDPGDRIDGKLVFQYGVCGQNCGGVDVCAAGPDECKRGDVNYNYQAYEPGDAVLFASYFVEGTSVFRYDMAYQICATDVNHDGRTLTLSDLVYLIRVILHDAVAIPKLAPSSEIASLIVTDGVVTAECASEIGALLFEFDGAVNTTLLADNMEIVANGNKVLVWSRTGQTIQNAEVVSYTGAQLVSVQAVDRDSRTLETVITARMTPTAFALHAAYPNPFNPSTNLSFNLPEAASYSMRIYNVAGQLVRSYEGMGSQGLNVITWDGKDNSGSEVSSGIYFYKLTAAGNSATEKMVMMK
jgi:hypothetical protein